MSKPSRTWFVASPSTSLWPGGRRPVWPVAVLGAVLGLSALMVPFLLSTSDDGTLSPGRRAAGLSQPAADPTLDPTTSATPSLQATPSAQTTTQTRTPEMTPKPSAASPPPANRPSQEPTPSTSPPRTPRERPSATPPPKPAPTFTPVTISAVDPGNTRVGVQESACATCLSGARISYLEHSRSLTVPVNGVAVAGTRRLTIAYECGDTPRDLVVTVNGGADQRLTALPTTANWQTPGWTGLDIDLREGRNTIRFHNPTGPAPDLDQFQIS